MIHTMLTAEANFLNNFSRSQRTLNLCYNGSNSFLLVNASKIYEFKTKDSWNKKISLVL